MYFYSIIHFDDADCVIDDVVDTVVEKVVPSDSATVCIGTRLS